MIENGANVKKIRSERNNKRSWRDYVRKFHFCLPLINSDTLHCETKFLIENGQKEYQAATRREEQLEASAKDAYLHVGVVGEVRV